MKKFSRKRNEGGFCAFYFLAYEFINLSLENCEFL